MKRPTGTRSNSAAPMRVLQLAAVTLLLAGCWPHKPPDDTTSGTGDVNVGVRVLAAGAPVPAGLTCDPQPDAKSRRICIDQPETINLAERGKDAISITWTISGAGAAFDAKLGIDVNPKNPDVFRVVTADPGKYTVTFARRDGRRYKYTITLQDPAIPPWDPFIAN